jgi:hypothetical protein
MKGKIGSQPMRHLFAQRLTGTVEVGICAALLTIFGREEELDIISVIFDRPIHIDAELNVPRDLTGDLEGRPESENSEQDDKLSATEVSI